MTQNTGAFEALLQEDRTYPPPAEFAANANIADPSVYEEARRDPEAFWARFAGELDWFQPWDTVLDWSDAPFRQVVRGRQAQRRVQLHRPAPGRPAQEQGGHHLGGRAGRLAGVHLPRPVPGSVQVRQRFEEPGRE